MSILTDIISNFTKVKTYYDFATSIWDIVEDEIPKLTKSFYCDNFTPNQQTILNVLKSKNSKKYEEFLTFLEVQESKSINSTSTFSKSILEQSLASKYSIDIRSLENLKVQEDINTFTKTNFINQLKLIDPCINTIKAPQDFKIQDFTKPEVSEKLQELIDKCKKAEEFKDKNFPESKKFTPEEVEQIVCDIQKDDRFVDGLKSLDSFTNNTKPKEFNKVQDVQEEPEPNFTNDIPLLNEFLEDDFPCFKTILEKTKELSDKATKYSNSIASQSTIERNWFYSTVIHTYYKEVLYFIQNPTLTVSVANSYIIPALNGISNEFKAVQVQDFLDISISKKNPKDLKGSYFNIDKKISKKVKTLVDEKRYKELEAIKEQRDKDFQKATKSILKSWVSEVYSENQKLLLYYREFAKSELKTGNLNIYTFTDYTEEGKINTIVKYHLQKNINFIQQKFDNSKRMYDSAKSKYDKFLKDSVKAKKELDDSIAQYEKDMQELPCKQDERVFSPADLEEPKDGDFRGLNDINKPSYYDAEYWKRFAKLATIVGLIPIPQFTISNDIKINLRDFTNPQISIPSGSIAIDDDGIPRFLFYPIGLVIPTILSADFIYRIPIPIIWKFLGLTKIESPIKKLTEKLLNIQKDIGEFAILKDYYGTTLPYSDIIMKMKDASVENFMRVLGIDKDVNISTLKKKLVGNNIGYVKSFREEFYDKLKPAEDGVDDSILFLQSRTDEISKWLEVNVNNVVNNAQNFVDEKLKDIDLNKYRGVLDGIVGDIESVINAIEDVLNLFQNCSGISTTNLINFKREYQEYLDSFKKYSNSEIPTDFQFPRLSIPNLRLRDYFDFSLSSLEKGFDEFFEGIVKGVSSFFLDIEKYISKYFYKIMRYSFFKFDLDPTKLGIKIPKDLIQSLVISNYNIPELLLVYFLGISGIFPYPFVLAINPTNTDIPLIPAKTIEFLLTLDILNPIKKIKKNFGSYCLPLPTLVDNVLNSTLGYIGDLATPNVNGKIDIDLCTLTTKYKDFEWFKNPIQFKSFIPSLKDLYSMFEVPNPFVICKIAQAKSFKDALDISLRELKVNKNLLPAKIEKLKGLENISLTNLDGNVLVDEFKKNFNVSAVPRLSDFVNFSSQNKTDYYKAEIGMSKKAIIDLFPELSRWSPYLQDDLPSWERLNLGNIPFVFFLIEFCIAGKRGAKFPIPEILPYLNM